MVNNHFVQFTANVMPWENKLELKPTQELINQHAQNPKQKIFTPVNHTNPQFMGEQISYQEGDDINDKVWECFQNRIKAGTSYRAPFGTQITVIQDVASKLLYVASIADKQFTLPAFAADFVPMLKGTQNGADVYYFVGINRGFPPGEGKPATGGGLCNVKVVGDKEVFSSLLATALSEGKQEICSAITLKDATLESIKTAYDLKEIQGTLKFHGRNLPCRIVQAATIPTSDKLMSEGGEMIEGANGHKRVHVAAAVAVLVDTQQPLTAEFVQKNFNPNSDARGLQVFDVTQLVQAASNQEEALRVASELHEKEGWGIDHHKEILAAGLYEAHQQFIAPPKKTVENLQRELDQLNTEKQGLQQQLADVQQRLEKADQSAGTAQQKQAELEEKIAELNQTQQDLQTQLEAKEQALAESQETVVKVQQELETTRRGLEAQVQDLTNTNSTLNDRILELTQQLKTPRTLHSRPTSSSSSSSSSSSTLKDRDIRKTEPCKQRSWTWQRVSVLLTCVTASLAAIAVLWSRREGLISALGQRLPSWVAERFGL